MKARFLLIRRNERLHRFYCLDTVTGKRISIQTQDEDVASQIVLAKNQARRQPALNLQIAKAYLAGTDSGVATRTRRDAIVSVIDTILQALKVGTVSTNVFLRCLHNFCVAMKWLPWPLVPHKQWPAVRYKDKRAITLDEHRRIIVRELNPERRAFYELCWHLAARSPTSPT